MLLNSHSCHERVSQAQLTFKELEVLSHCKKGLSCKAISEILFVTEETVKTHRKNIVKKQEFRKFLIDLSAEELILQYKRSPQRHPFG